MTLRNFEKVIAEDTQHVVEVAALSATFMLDLWLACTPPVEPMEADVPGELDAFKMAFGQGMPEAQG